MTSRRARAVVAASATATPSAPLTRVDLAVMRVHEVAGAFERRWSLRSLKRVDPDLYQKFRDQQGDWHKAIVTGDAQAVAAETDIMCRGWAAIARRMEEAGAPEDAFLVGEHQDTQVVISENRMDEAELRRARPGQRIIFVTPDEVAAMVDGLGDVALQVKEMWPGAEIREVRTRTAE